MANEEGKQKSRRDGRGGDLRLGNFPIPAGGDEDVCAYSRSVYEYAVDQANEAIGWYRRKKPWKKRWAIGTRAGSIVFVGLGTFLPLLLAAGIPLQWGGWQFSQLAFISLALAGGCLGLDKCWGFSSDWMRYMTTEQKLLGLLEEFHFDWATLYACHPGQAVPPVPEMLGRTQKFLGQIRRAVELETTAWATDYLRRVAAVEDAVGRKADAGRAESPAPDGAAGSKPDADTMPRQTTPPVDVIPPTAPAAGVR